MKHTLVLLLSCILSLGALPCAAANSVGSKVITYVDETGGSVSIVRYGPRKNKTFLVLFENFDDDWDGKVILHHYDDSTRNKKYEIHTPKPDGGYSIFQSIVDSGKRAAFKGGTVSTVQLYLKSLQQPVTLYLSEKSAWHPDDLFMRYQKQQSAKH